MLIGCIQIMQAVYKVYGMFPVIFLFVCFLGDLLRILEKQTLSNVLFGKKKKKKLCGILLSNVNK